MAENKVPSGVGKKIVEALKKQNEVEIEIQPIQEFEDTISSNIETATEAANFEENNNSKEVETIANDFSDFSLENEDIKDFSEYDENKVNEIENELETSEFDNIFASDFSFENIKSNMFEEQEIFNTNKNQTVPTTKTYAMPANVAVLKRLIMQLPQGVSKQTGAQIIRQTMEALGISMSSVLKEAQQGQDSITASAKACLSTIAEYKNNIKTLEKQVQDYKKQAVALNDLISLFVLTDKN